MNGQTVLSSFAVVFTLGILPVNPPQAAESWPQIGYNAGHSGFNPQETVVDSGNVAGLTLFTTLPTPGEVADPAMVANGYAYVNSIGSNALYAFDVASSQQLWSFTGTNLDSPRGIAVAGNEVFVTCVVGSQVPGLCALNYKTGKLIWNWSNAPSNSLPGSPPAVSGDVVYFVESQPYGDWLTALDTKTGAQLWQYGYCNPEGICVHLGQNAPAIDGGMVFVGCSTLSPGEGVCAIDAATGALAWFTQLGGTSADGQWGDGSGNLIASKGVVYANYITSTCYGCDYTVNVVALNEETGTALWDTPITKVLNNTYGPVGPPALNSGHLYAALACCDAKNDSGLVKLNATSGKIAWHAETSYWLSSSPSLVNDVVFLECAGHGGTICAFDASTGTDLWDSPDSGSSSSDPPVVTGGMVYEICNYNNVCVYSPQSQ